MISGWYAVKRYAKRIGMIISLPVIFVALAPASVMVLEANVEQIQFLLGHALVQTTERYIGCRQKFNKRRSTIGFKSR